MPSGVTTNLLREFLFIKRIWLKTSEHILTSFPFPIKSFGYGLRFSPHKSTIVCRGYDEILQHLKLRLRSAQLLDLGQTITTYQNAIDIKKQQ